MRSLCIRIFGGIVKASNKKYDYKSQSFHGRRGGFRCCFFGTSKCNRLCWGWGQEQWGRSGLGQILATLWLSIVNTKRQRKTRKTAAGGATRRSVRAGTSSLTRIIALQMIVCQLGSWNSSVADVSRRLRLDYSPLLAATASAPTPPGDQRDATLGRLRIVVALVIVSQSSVFIRHSPHDRDTTNAHCISDSSRRLRSISRLSYGSLGAFYVTLTVQIEKEYTSHGMAQNNIACSFSVNISATTASVTLNDVNLKLGNL